MPTGFTSKAIFAALMAAALPLSAYDLTQEKIDFKQLHVGFNGPSTAGRYFFHSPTDLASSWLVSSLGDQTQAMLSQVDFSHQILIVATVGERSTTTGNVSISEIWKFGAGIVPFVRIGVNERSCNEPRRASFPFVVAVIEKPSAFNPNEGGYDNQNFPDGCKAVPGGNEAIVGHQPR